jgi:GNAT superfamily N-acetyltransferase
MGGRERRTVVFTASKPGRISDAAARNFSSCASNQPAIQAGMLEIRFATPEDAALILRFIQALAEYERMPDAVEVDAPTLARQLGEARPPFECLLAHVDGEPAGFALFVHNYSTWRGKRGIWLEDLFVLPAARRHGVGKALLQRVAELAASRDCARLEWSVLDWNALAIDFYQTIGAAVLAEWKLCRISGRELEELAAGIE